MDERIIRAKDPVSEQLQGLGKQPLSKDIIGSLSGKSAKIPGKTNPVFENQLVDRSKFFTWGELTHGLTRIPENAQITANIISLCEELDWIRKEWGSPIAISSGYRPKVVNDAVGGAKFSMHLQGKAADIYPVFGSLNDLLLVVKRSRISGIGLGMHRGFIHVDTRGGGRVVFPY